MKVSLQNQYKLIKEGKGHKDVFLKEAKSQFPNYIANQSNFDQAVHLLKDKGVIAENIVNITPKENDTTKEDFESAFNAFLTEAKKDELEDSEKVKAEEKNPIGSPNTHDNSDDKNIDNVIFDQLMAGYYIEMKKEKNCDKTVQEIKDIVLKNLQKDPIFYVTKGQFGLEDIGYQVEAPGLGEPKEPKGPYKSSGYGNLNENKNSNMTLQEQKLRKVIRTIIKEELSKNPLNENVDKRLKEIEGESQLEALQSKINKLDEEIEKRNTQLGMLDENEDLSELLDKNAVKKIQKEIKLLEKVKSKYEKMCEKMEGKGAKKSIIDEDDELNENEEQPSSEYLADKEDAEERYDTGEDIESILADYPEFKDMLEKDIIGKFEGSDY